MYNAQPRESPRPEDRELDVAEATQLLGHLVQLARLLDERIELRTAGGFRWPVAKDNGTAEIHHVAAAIADELNRR